MMFEPTKPRFNLYSRELVYTQERDTWDAGQDDQELRIATHDSGGGSYLTIETQRWGLDREDIPAFCELLMKSLEGLE